MLIELLALVEQGGDDAAQVAAGGFFRLGGAARDDGGDDRQVLGQRRLRAARAQRQLELMADQLPVQPLEQAGRHRLTGDLPDQPVQLVVERRVLQRLAVRDAAFELLAQLAQPRGLALSQPFGRLRRAQSLERHPALGDRDRLVEGDGAHPRAAVRYPLDQSLRRQVEQRRAQAGARHPEHPGQLFLDQPLPGRHVPGQDRLLQPFTRQPPPGGARERRQRHLIVSHGHEAILEMPNKIVNNPVGISGGIPDRLAMPRSGRPAVRWIPP